MSDEKVPFALFWLDPANAEGPRDKAIEQAVQKLSKKFVAEASKRGLDWHEGICVALEFCARVLAAPLVAVGTQSSDPAAVSLSASMAGNLRQRMHGVLAGNPPGEDMFKSRPAGEVAQ